MKPLLRRGCRLIALTLLFVSATFAAIKKTPQPYGVVTVGPGFAYSRLGNQNDVTTLTQAGFMFEGGGLDVDVAYQWMCKKANGGDFLVITADAGAVYNPYIYGLCPSLNSVSTLQIDNREGSSQAMVAQVILNAEAVFITGGDQSKYVKFYAGTPVTDAINTLAGRGVPIGGTSAGNAILAQFGYSGFTGSVTSAQALKNPFTPLITLSNGFLDLSPLLLGKITDDHFVTRNRMGRLVTFLARIVQGGLATQAFGIASDEQTAFLVEADGSGIVVGTSRVYFLRTPGPPEVCQPNTPLTYNNLSVYRVEAGGTFNISTWTGTGGASYTLSAVGGVLHSSQGHIY